jgi:hypothetical protein
MLLNDVLRRLVGGDSPEDVGDDICEPLASDKVASWTKLEVMVSSRGTGDLLKKFSFYDWPKGHGEPGNPVLRTPPFWLIQKIDRGGNGASEECSIKDFAYLDQPDALQGTVVSGNSH